MKPFLILVASSFVLAFGSGCMKILPDSIEPIPNTLTSIEDSLSSNLDSGNSIENTSIYNINELTAGFIKPIKKDNQLTFIDKFIDGEFKDIDYLDRKIEISNCNDLINYDLRETSNIANSDRNILLTRKRACILIKDITNDSNIIALNDKYKNSKFIPIADKHLKKIVDSELLSRLPILNELISFFVDKKENSLSVKFDELLRENYTTVLTYGTFDLLHYGHLELLYRAKDYGNRLIVGLSSDEFNLEKGKKCEFDYKKRKQYLSSLDIVDQVIPETNWDQKIQDIKNHKVDYFIMGDDWKGKFDYLKECCKVIDLPRTKGVSTTDLKKILYNE